ncbi:MULTISPECIES: TetR/AcrR family transcriptional regulator [Actinomadura]|uniref:TetR/AcrR family transcriptional regulator n=1 Tax=Actinomadura yumaensis TaxID=111807 RepID=A0ABW2CDG4_9ACTN|nr:TetR/AcrR family transcriptional regulator [Actinomadura sp. J1-007]MWK38226.1 TetR family transcriptional regulator [Actinomadura sp. J1-007]
MARAERNSSKGEVSDPQTGADVENDPRRQLVEERRRAKDDISRQYILDAAEVVFSRNGLHAATVREIAAEAGFSSGALYRFFKSKDDILTHVMERKGRRLVEELEKAADPGMRPAQRLHALAEAQMRYYSANRDFYRLILRTAGPSWWTLKAEFDDMGVQRFHRALDIEAEMFRAGIEAGEFVDDEPEQMAVVFVGITQAYLTRWLLQDDGASAFDRGEAKDRLLALLDRAFVRPAAR